MSEAVASPNPATDANGNGSSSLALEAVALTKHYGTVKAVENINFTVKRGEIVGFLGPNGAGKSTTMRIFSGLLSATSGRAYVAGVPVARYPDEVKRHLGYMPEHNPLPDDMRVIEYLRFRARLKELPRKKIRPRVEEAMEICGLHRKARRRLIGNLSKGFRQRVGIADAILAEPEVILMDEPTIGLDPHQILGIRRLIDSLRGRLTVVISSHILQEIEASCDRVMIINQGRLVAVGTSESLRRELMPNIRWRLCVRAEAEAVEKFLPEIHPALRLAGRGATDADGFVELRLEGPSSEPGLGEGVLAAAARSGLRVRELARVQPSLEEIFIAATKTDEAPPSATRAK